MSLILNISFNILASVGHFFITYDNKMSVWKGIVFSVRAPKRKYFKIFGGKQKPGKTLATLRPSFSTFRCSTRIPYGKFSVNCRLYEGRLTKNSKSHVLRSPETLPDVRKHESNTYTDQWCNSSKLFVLIHKVIWCEPCYYFSVPHQWEWAVWWEANSSSSCNLKKNFQC